MKDLGENVAPIKVWAIDIGSMSTSGWPGAPIHESDLTGIELFPDSEHRSRVAGRAALRLILGRELDVSPQSIKFDRICRHCGDRRHGKPKVSGTSNLYFSISYTRDIALVAVSWRCEVGIDAQPIVPFAPVHRSSYAPAEQEFLRSLPSSERDTAAARAWVRKEAVAKVSGLGLALPLSSVDLSGPSSRWNRGHHRFQVDDLPDWGVRTVVAALACVNGRCRWRLVAFERLLR